MDWLIDGFLFAVGVAAFVYFALLAVAAVRMSSQWIEDLKT
jgi:hypothetical protein